MTFFARHHFVRYFCSQILKRFLKKVFFGVPTDPAPGRARLPFGTPLSLLFLWITVMPVAGIKV